MNNTIYASLLIIALFILFLLTVSVIGLAVVQWWDKIYSNKLDRKIKDYENRY